MAFDLKDVKQLIELMRRSDLSEFELEQEGVKVRIKRDAETGLPVVAAAPMPAYAPAPAPVHPGVPAAAAPAAPAAPVEEAGVSLIKSPMVGTFYRSPSPDSPSFAEAGTAVKEDTVVCIVEAMKVMNEIQAEIKGTITEVLVENGATVEYGQPLFKVKTA